MDTDQASVSGPIASQAPARGRAANAKPHRFIELLSGREPFLRLRSEWDSALEGGLDPSPALEHDFLRLWLESFVPGRTPLTLVARRAGRIDAALGITLSRTPVDGLPVTLADAWCNAHGTRGGVLLGADALDAIPALVHRLGDLGWDVLRLRDVPREGGTLDTLTQALRDEGCAVHLASPMDSPYVPLPSNWEELERRLDARFRQNLRRRRRRLEEHGPVRLETVTGGDELDAALEDAFEIEASGWKGQEGSAIRARPELVAFYAGWARQLARSGRLRMNFLTLDGRRIAFHFAFVHRGRYYLPKCGYSELHADCSPGQQLVAEVLQRCVEEGLESFEFLGFSMGWKRDWTPLVRPHATVWAFRPTVAGRLARLVRAQARPRVVRAARQLRDSYDQARHAVDQRWRGMRAQLPRLRRAQ